MTNLEPVSESVGADAVSLDLGEGLTLLVTPSLVDGDGDLAQTSWRDEMNGDAFFATIERLATTLTSALKAAAPTKITAEFGVGAAVKAGKLTALLLDGQGEASIKVTLEWDRRSAES